MTAAGLRTVDALVTVAELEHAVIQAEHLAGLTPPGMRRPLFPWERHTDFADIDRTLTTGYDTTARTLIELRDQLAGLIGPDLTDEQLLDLLLRPPPEVRQLMANSAQAIARALRQVQLAEARRTLRQAKKQGIRPTANPVVAPIAEWRVKGRLIVQSLWHHVAEAAVNTARDTTDRTASTAAADVSIKAAQDQARQTVHEAAGKGRAAAADVLTTPKRIYASELLDASTCVPCSHVDGKPYDTEDEALDDYPNHGGYTSCEGGDRCRGTLVYVWDEADPTIDDTTPWVDPDEPPPAPPVTAPFPSTPDILQPDLRRLTQEERDAIEYYTGPGSIEINQALRGLRPMQPRIQHEADLIRAGLRKFPLPATVRLTRAAPLTALGVDTPDALSALVGERFRDRGFMSTSIRLNPGTPAGAVILDLIVPAGTPALRIVDELTDFPLEQEVLVIDARLMTVLGVVFDEAADRWRVYVAVEEEERK